MLETVHGARLDQVRDPLHVDGLDGRQTLDGPVVEVGASAAGQAESSLAVAPDSDGRGQHQEEKGDPGCRSNSNGGLKSPSGSAAAAGWESVNQRSGRQRTGLFRLDDGRLVSVDGERRGAKLDGVRGGRHQIDLDVVDGVRPEAERHRGGVSVKVSLEAPSVHLPGDQVVAGLPV